MGSILGTLFRVSTWGETRGPEIGCTVDGCPSQMALSERDIQKELDRRRPGQSDVTSPRKEDDIVEIFSGVLDGMTTGAPIALRIKNKRTSTNTADDPEFETYQKRKITPRPGHSDYAYRVKYEHFDSRHGGRSSGRETAARVAAGAVALKALSYLGVQIVAYTRSIGRIVTDTRFDVDAMSVADAKSIVESNSVRTLDAQVAEIMRQEILRIQAGGDSVGGVVEVVALNVPPGLGEPVFDKLNADLAKAMFSIPAVAGVGIGDGFRIASMKGSEYVDEFIVRAGKVWTATNRAGGIKGGISIGTPITMEIAVKPTTSIKLPKRTVNLDTMESETVSVPGEHDPCIVPRIVPVIEAMMALTLTDHALISGKMPRVFKPTKHSHRSSISKRPTASVSPDRVYSGTLAK